MRDYRNTNYCESLDQIIQNKQSLKEDILSKHPTTQDFHNFVSVNNKEYKEKFMKIYNDKCAYCGLSNILVPIKTYFQIDHFIFKKSYETKVEAGDMSNLVLSCQECNSKKRDFDLTNHPWLHPDKRMIKDIFIRNDHYNIEVSEKYSQNEVIQKFYSQLDFGNETKRIDYLCLSIYYFKKSIENIPEIYVLADKAFDLLRNKRKYL